MQSTCDACPRTLQDEEAHTVSGRIETVQGGNVGVGEKQLSRRMGANAACVDIDLRGHLGETKVEHFHRAVGSQLDVARFQIAMHDTLVVRGLERVADLPRDRQRFLERNRTLGDAIRKRRPLDE